MRLARAKRPEAGINSLRLAVRYTAEFMSAAAAQRWQWWVLIDLLFLCALQTTWVASLSLSPSLSPCISVSFSVARCVCAARVCCIVNASPEQVPLPRRAVCAGRCCRHDCVIRYTPALNYCNIVLVCICDPLWVLHTRCKLFRRLPAV